MKKREAVGDDEVAILDEVVKEGVSEEVTCP